MCGSYSGPSGTGILAYARDRFGKGKQAGGGVNTGGYSGPSAAGAMSAGAIRQKQTVPLLDNKFGVNNGG